MQAAPSPADYSVVEKVVVQGDLSKLAPQDRIEYYKQVCDSVGLNPLTKPFEYITLNGKLVLYATRACTDQLRKINGVSVTIVCREQVADTWVVTAQATDKTGRCDESIGAVPLAGLKGEAHSNAIMKAETKAKRRVTLSICGLGFLDESELDGALAAPYGRPQRPNGAEVAQAARISTDAPVDPAVRDTLIKGLERIAADQGVEAYALAWAGLPKEGRKLVGADEHARLKTLAERKADENDAIELEPAAEVKS